MNTHKDKTPLNQSASSSAIQDFYSQGYLDQQARKEAIKLLCPPKIMWQFWADRMLVLFSAALILAGVVFFFAYNWANMAAWLKLGLIQIAIVGCVIITLIKGVQQLVGKVFLLAASLFVGVLLAVYGQIYQTGADAYQLFAGWALLITGWVIVSKFGGLWLMWLLLINTAIVLYFEQVLADNPDKLVTLLSLLNVLFIAAREYAVSKGVTWLSGKWLRWVVLTAVFFFLTSYVMILIVEIGKTSSWSILPPIMLLGIILGSSYFYYFRSPDLFCLTLSTLSVCAVVLTILGKVIFDATGDNALVVLMFGLIILAVVSVAAFLLREVGKSLGTGSDYGN
jgi:uncharacterized membrane protein